MSSQTTRSAAQTIIGDIGPRGTAVYGIAGILSLAPFLISFLSSFRRYGAGAVLAGTLPVLLGGCVGIVREGVRANQSTNERATYLAAAESGDASAQFKLGASYCCSPIDSDPIYDNRKAAQWLCASARQNYAPAMLKLGQIYSGNTIDGVRLTWRAVSGASKVFMGTREELAVAYAWTNMAMRHGAADSAKLSKSIWDVMNPSERDRATQMLKLGMDIPCEWDAVLKPPAGK